jgi:hypothetical protein
MIRSTRTMGKLLAAIVAVFAFGALAAASASANAPEFVPRAGESFPVSISNSLHAGSVSFSWPSMTWGTCSENKTEGTITAAKTVSLTLEWTGCSSGWHTEGSPEGHVVITGTGTLSYAAEHVGVVLAIKEVKLVSGATSIKLRGSLVIPIGPLNTETNKFALPIHEVGLGEQEFSSYENESGEVREARPQIEFGTSSKRAGIEVQGANELTTGKSLSIKTPPAPPFPEFALGEGGTFPVTLEGTSPTASAGLYASAGAITCEGVNTKGTLTGGRFLSTLTYELQHCKKGTTTECQTGAEAGTIVLSGSANVFYIKKAEERVALILALNEAKVSCGAQSVKVKGSLIIRVTPVGFKTTQPVLELTRNGELPENTYTTYENDAGEVISVHPELNFGTGFKKGAVATGERHVTASKTVTLEG